jgi:hypothetical protein
MVESKLRDDQINREQGEGDGSEPQRSARICPVELHGCPVTVWNY